MYIVGFTSFVLSAALAAQTVTTVEFTELLIDPVGPNAGAQIVEMRNTGVTSADLTGWQLVTPAGTFALPPVILPWSGIVLLRLGQSGVSNQLDIFLPTVPALGSAGTLALFRSAATSSANELVDFVAWGGGQATMTIAQLAGQWPHPANQIAVPIVEGHTMAHFEDMTYGSRSEAAAWFADGTPTLGTPNDGGGLFAGTYGCPQLTFGPQIGSGEANNRPWLGESWRLDTSYMPVLPTTMWVAFGLQTLGTLPLDGLGITGCFWDTSLDVVVPVLVSTYPQSFFVSLPNQPSFVGSPLYVQAAVAAPGANPAGLLITRTVFAYPGLR